MIHRLRLVLVEDEPSIRAAMAETLADHACEVTALSSVPPAWGGPRPDAVVLDLQLADTEGEDTIDAAAACWPGVPLVIWTGTARSARQLGLRVGEGPVDSFLIKGSTSSFDLAAAAWQAWGRQQARTPDQIADALAAVFLR